MNQAMTDKANNEEKNLVRQTNSPKCCREQAKLDLKESHLEIIESYDNEYPPTFPHRQALESPLPLWFPLSQLRILVKSSWTSPEHSQYTIQDQCHIFRHLQPTSHDVLSILSGPSHKIYRITRTLQAYNATQDAAFLGLLYTKSQVIKVSQVDYKSF